MWLKLYAINASRNIPIALYPCITALPLAMEAVIGADAVDIGAGAIMTGLFMG